MSFLIALIVIIIGVPILIAIATPFAIVLGICILLLALSHLENAVDTIDWLYVLLIAIICISVWLKPYVLKTLKLIKNKIKQ